MRRAVVAALAFFAFAPGAHAADPCGVTATPVVGSAPLTVTFTAGCASSGYAWSFGDGEEGLGQSVQHIYAAGAWHATLTTDAGSETAPAVTAISLRLSGPREARYARYVTLHASVTPRVPVVWHGRRFQHGKLRVRILGPAPFVATALGVRSEPLHVLVAPTLVVRTRGRAVVGSHVRVIATLHPRSAGTVVAPRRIDTRAAHVAHVVVHSRPARGWTAASASATVTIVQPNLALGASGQ